jgi:hypothetical protein
MDETSGTVRLVESRPDSEAHSLVATIGREEVERALGHQGPVDLLLDVERVNADGDDRETQRIALAWESEELERLLGSSSARELPLAFDERELRRLLDEDVEAHGMREKLAVLTVVAGMAAAGAGAAAGAIPRDDGGPAGGTAVAAATTQARASEVSAGLGVTTSAPAAAEAGRTAAASEVSTGLGPTQATEADRAATASEISTGIVGVAPAAPSEISTGIVQEPPVAPAEVTTGIVSHPSATPVASSPSGWSIDPAEAALAAGMILAVTAAGFIAHTQRRRPAMP